MVPKPPVRALTLGVAGPHPLDLPTVRTAASALHHAASGFGEAGYEVQTLRLSTRPVLADLGRQSPSSVIQYAARLQGWPPGPVPRARRSWPT